MITIKNNSNEDVEMVQHLDLDVPGCRLADQELWTELMPPGSELTFIAYEPGVSYTIRPVKEPELPRRLNEHGGYEKIEGVGT